MAEATSANDPNNIMREGDRADKNEADGQKKPSREASKRRTQQFEDQFAYKDNWESKSGRVSPFRLPACNIAVARLTLDSRRCATRLACSPGAPDKCRHSPAVPRVFITEDE
jgi:hypothetical protein